MFEKLKFWKRRKPFDGGSAEHLSDFLQRKAADATNPFEVLRALHDKALRERNMDLLTATTTALGVYQGMSSMAEQSGRERVELVQTFAAVVYAAGGSVTVRPEHTVQVPFLLLMSERSPVDDSVTWHAGVRQ